MTFTLVAALSLLYFILAAIIGILKINKIYMVGDSPLYIILVVYVLAGLGFTIAIFKEKIWGLTSLAIILAFAIITRIFVISAGEKAFGFPALALLLLAFVAGSIYRLTKDKER